MARMKKSAVRGYYELLSMSKLCPCEIVNKEIDSVHVNHICVPDKPNGRKSNWITLRPDAGYANNLYTIDYLPGLQDAV